MKYGFKHFIDLIEREMNLSFIPFVSQSVMHYTIIHSFTHTFIHFVYGLEHKVLKFAIQISLLTNCHTKNLLTAYHYYQHVTYMMLMEQGD